MAVSIQPDTPTEQNRGETRRSTRASQVGRGGGGSGPLKRKVTHEWVSVCPAPTVISRIGRGAHIHAHRVYEGLIMGRRRLHVLEPPISSEDGGPPSRAGAAFGGPACCGFRVQSLGSAAVARGVEPPSV